MAAKSGAISECKLLVKQKIPNLHSYLIFRVYKVGKDDPETSYLYYSRITSPAKIWD